MLRQIPTHIWSTFLPVFGITLAVTLILFQARLDFRSLTTGYLILNIAFAILISLGGTVVCVAGFSFGARFAGTASSNLRLMITRKTLQRSLQGYATPVISTGIGQHRGTVAVRLAYGAVQFVNNGDRFIAFYAATSEKIGVLEAIEVDEGSCLCRVSDRTNAGFWEELESRMERDPSPPLGVTFSREIPEGLTDFLDRLVGTWGR